MNDIWANVNQLENSCSNSTTKPNYLHVYNTSPQSIGENVNVTFDLNTINSNGFIHTVGTSEIIFTKSGVYLASFMIAGMQRNQFAFFLNDTLIPSSIFSSGGGNQQNNGQTFINANEGDILTIKNHLSGLTVNLQTTSGGSANNINASVTLLQIS